MLAPPVDARLKGLFAGTAGEHGMVIHEIELVPDRVGLVVEAAPTRRVAEFVTGINRRDDPRSRQASASLRPRLPAPWSRSPHSGSVGSVSDAAVWRFIEAQKRTCRGVIERRNGPNRDDVA